MMEMERMMEMKRMEMKRIMEMERMMDGSWWWLLVMDEKFEFCVDFRAKAECAEDGKTGGWAAFYTCEGRAGPVANQSSEHQSRLA